MTDSRSSERQWKIWQLTATASFVSLLSQKYEMLQFTYAWLGGLMDCIILNRRNCIILLSETMNDHENQKLLCHTEVC